MYRRIILPCLIAIVPVGFGTGSCRAQSTNAPSASTAEATPSPEEMVRQLHALQLKVNDLQSRLDAQQAAAKSPPATQPTAAPAESLQEVEAGMQADIAEHDGFDDLTAGYAHNKGFFIRSQDGSFLLHPWAFVQFRDAYNYRSEATATTDHDSENGFELPRMKLILDGNVFSTDLTYQFIWATSDTTGNLGLQDAWARYHIPGTIFAVEGGQIRDPVDHEQIVFATKSLTPDRSIVNNVLLNGDDIVKGIQLEAGYDTPSVLRGNLAFTSGERNYNTSFQDYPTNTADWGAAARVEWKLMGDWKDYTQFTALDDEQPLLVLGAGADYTEAGAAGGLTHVADVQYDLPCGLALYAAYLGRYVRDDAGAPTTNGQQTPGTTPVATYDTYDTSFRAMAAYLFDERFEPFVRYEYIRFDPHEFTTAVDPNINDITLGFNYYFYGHRAKTTVGASYLPQGSPVTSTIGDLLTSHKGEEFIFQAQFQLML